jgi:hypothetical protein
VAWVLSCVFVCFLEDNRLIDPPKLAGPGEHELFFRSRPHDTDREYLLSIFDDLAKRAGTRDLFGRHNPIRQLPEWLSPDAAQDLLLPFFQQIDPSLGARFLGDLYQDLSEAARKKYALLQTPVFVEEFILDRTLEPATSRCELVQRALAAVHGVDLNPYAVAIARHRLLLAAFVAASFQLADSAGQVGNLPPRLANIPDFRPNLACGDALPMQTGTFSTCRCKSATVGNPEELLDWLAGACQGERQVCHPPETAEAAEGHIEPVVPPSEPYHILARQLMALCLPSPHARGADPRGARLDAGRGHPLRGRRRPVTVMAGS